MNLILLPTIIAFLSTTIVGSNLKPSSCAELLVQGNKKSGLYTVHARAWYGACAFKVYCDMDTDGGGWTLFQRRGDYEIQENFTRDWNDYRDGFGNLERDFWLGNEYIYILSNQDRTALRIELEDFENNSRVAQYHYFHISNETENYKLDYSGYHGNANDALGVHNGKEFSTYDKDNAKTCAKQCKGGWWYHECYEANLNGMYKRGAVTPPPWDAIEWHKWLPNYSLKKVEMKVRPVNFSPHCTFSGK